MKSKAFIISLSLIVLVGLVTSCSEAPQTLIDETKAAFDAANQAEVNRYLPELYNEAQSKMDSAMTEIESQNSKFSLMRSYSKATALLQSASETAGKSVEAVALRKQEIQKETETLFQDLDNSMKESGILISKAPKGKEGRAALESIQNELKIVETVVNEAKSAQNGNDFLTARDKARAALDKVNSLNAELQTAIAKKMALQGKR
ncbi:MAG: hypothetical protein AB7W47_12800 [Calditrichaceae bacterium]